MADADVQEEQIKPAEETEKPKTISCPRVNGDINVDISKEVVSSGSGGSKKKKKKKKGRKEAEGDEKDGSLSPTAASGMPVQNIRQLQNLQKTFELLRVADQYKPAKTIEEANKKTYHFWETQPVPKLGELNSL